METIRFFGLADLSSSHYLERCQSELSKLDSIEETIGVNDTITLFNILRYAEAGLADRMSETALSRARELIGRFGSVIDPLGLDALYNQVRQEYHDDFWALVASYRWFQKYSKDRFEIFLNSVKPNIRPMLRQKALLKEYKEQIRIYFLSSPYNATIFIEAKSRSTTPAAFERPHIPEGLSIADIQDLFSRYVELDDCAYGYLEIIANMHEVSDRTKLQARRKIKDMSDSIFSEATGFTFGVEVKYVEQVAPVAMEIENAIAKFSYDINWVTKELDPPTILNNFIYLFEYLDKFGRMSLAAYHSEVAVMERLFNTERDDWYPVGIAFIQKNQAALMQLHSYTKILESSEVRLENVLEWFFSNYLNENYEIQGFQVALPGPATSYFEKCRIVAPEIERIIKQYKAYVEDGEIDQELLSIGSQPTPVAGCPSLLQGKYAYQNSANVQRAIYYLFSDQCMLSYDSKTQTSHVDFLTRIRLGGILPESFDSYLHPDIDWLVAHQYLSRTPEGVLSLLNLDKALILRDLYQNESIVINRYPASFLTIIKEMIGTGDLIVENSLFSRSEKNYIDYHLNKSKFINSLDLRNRYAHGSVPSAAGGENAYMLDYLQLLKLIVLVVLKINDDFEQRSIVLAGAAEA